MQAQSIIHCLLLLATGNLLEHSTDIYIDISDDSNNNNKYSGQHGSILGENFYDILMWDWNIHVYRIISSNIKNLHVKLHLYRIIQL